MKKFGSILLLVLIVAAGCNKSDPEPEETRRANLLGTGDSANDILSNSEFDKLLIEVAYVAGFRPTEEAINGFVDYLRLHTFKQSIEVRYNEVPSSDKTVLELQEVADLETENRTAYNDGKTLAIYIFFADAPSVEDDEEEGLFTLGAVYRNTSMVIYETTVRRLAGNSILIDFSDVELATLNHEFGHLFGLVNLGSIPVNAHEDTEAPNHCNVDVCLMRAELQFQSENQNKLAALSTKNSLKNSCNLNGLSLLSMLQKNSSKGRVEIPPIDAECVLDLQANGGR